MDNSHKPPSPDNVIDFNDLQEGRYDRQELVAWWDQDLLRRARVIIAGAGALGNEVLKLCTLMGAGHIILVDYDRVSLSNLARMVLFRSEDTGKPKVEAAARRAAEINPEVEIVPVQGDLRFDLGLGDYRQADIVFGCLDSVNARWALNRRCLQAGVEWINGGISDFHGLVELFSPAEGACYECTFTPQTSARFNSRYSCPFGLVSGDAGSKVPTTAVTTSVIAALQVQQGMLTLHNAGGGLNPGERLTVYMKPYRMTVDRLPANPDCLAHNPLPGEIRKAPFSRASTVREVLQEPASASAGLDRLHLAYDLVVSFDCPACGSSQPVLRPKEKVQQAESRCPACGEMRTPRLVSEIALGSDLAGLSLQEAGIPAREILALGDGNQVEYIQIN